jgi:hypothetical protein
VKRLLLAGYGNIAHAFEQIMAEQEPSGTYTLTTCDLKDGQRGNQIPSQSEVCAFALMLAYSWLSLSPMSWYVFSREYIYTDV